MFDGWRRWPRRVLGAGVALYRCSLGLWLGGGCRFVPSCSAFAAAALRQRGARAGGILILRRLLRCHPWYPATPPVHRLRSSVHE